ncbi:MAG TPA: carboxypeptidase regulatory-like domain-containing protein [Acidimicrobiales bacterium]|nr:carboxypeptidase regulatory-like domain-containing protein [Acidimicrobiales bacterium]
MRVQLEEPQDALVPGEPVELAVDVTNGLAVIDGVRVELENRTGLEWTAEPDLLPLFPDGTGTVTVTITAPPGLAAGAYRLPVQVRSTAEPAASTVQFLPVQVRPAPSMSLAVHPSDRTARRRTSYDVVCRNTGNVPLEVDLAATDTAHLLTCRPEPAALRIGPGHDSTARLTVSCKRRLLGNEVAHRAQLVASSTEAQAETGVTFRQRPIFPRGARTILLLAAIVGVWAAVMVVALNHALNSNPPQKIAPASFYASSHPTNANAAYHSSGAGANPPPAGAVPKSGLDIAAGGTLAGIVDAASTGSGVGRITVQAYALEQAGRAVLQASTATAADGTWAIPGLLPGPYKIEISAQGFTTEWYPSSASESGGKTIQVHGLKKTGGLRAVVKGLPGSITGSVVTGETPPPSVTVTVTPGQGSSTTPVATVTTSSSGSYTITGIPTPNSYDLSFTAPGFQPGSDTEVLTGGQHDIANTITLSAQPGSISGMVTGGSGALGGVTVTASANGQTFKTATPTSGAVGTFTLGNLPSPATYLLTFAAPGYGTATIAQQLGPGQALKGLTVSLSGGAGDISGTVVAQGGGALGGVTVTITGATKPVSTQTLTAGQIGSFELAGLPTPGQYTLTFSLSGYTSVTIPVNLGSGASASGVDATMAPANGSIDGTVMLGGTGVAGATITVTDGGPPLTTVSTTDPAGSFSLSGVAPGTYSVTATLSGQTATVQVTVVAGDTATPTLTLVATS